MYKASSGNPVLNGIGVQSSSNLTTAMANNNALLLPHWRLALQKVRDNTGDARILCVGDSTTSGVGSTGGNVQNSTSFPQRLIQFMNTTITPTVAGCVIPTTGSPADSRVPLPSGWSNQGFGAGANASYEGPDSAGNGVFSPAVNCDGMYFIYEAGGAGTVTATVTGGTPTVVTFPGTNGTFRSPLISAGSASAANTLTLTPAVSGNFVFFAGVEPVLSTKRQVLVSNAGVPGSTTTDWAVTNAPSGGADFIKAVAPDLTIISLGINDAAAAVSAATVSTNLQTLITAAKVSGDVILATPLPNQTAGTIAQEKLYLPVYYSLAQSNSCLLLDEFARLGSAYNANFMNGDGTHGNDYGYWDWSQAFMQLLTSF